MFSTRRELIVGALLAALALLGWWYSAARMPAAPIATDSQRRPDYLVENLTGVTMGADGLPARLLATPLLRHYADDGSSDVQTPVMTVFSDDAPPWIIRSERGWISADGDELLLQGDVRAERASTPELAPLVLVSSELLVLPDVDYAETDRFAELERGEDWVTANDGMQVWFGEHMRVKLFGRNRTRVGPRIESGEAADDVASRDDAASAGGVPVRHAVGSPDDRAVDSIPTSAD